MTFERVLSAMYLRSVVCGTVWDRSTAATVLVKRMGLSATEAAQRLDEGTFDTEIGYLWSTKGTLRWTRLPGSLNTQRVWTIFRALADAEWLSVDQLTDVAPVCAPDVRWVLALLSQADYLVSKRVTPGVDVYALPRGRPPVYFAERT